MHDTPCDYCNNPQSSFIDTDMTFICVNCMRQLNTCAACIHAVECEFENNPSPLPKQVQKTIRQGNMVAQTIVKNPDRIREFCLYACPCFSEENGCGKELGYCANYKEVEPAFKTSRLESYKNDEA